MVSKNRTVYIGLNTDTFGTALGVRSRMKSDARLIESQIKGVKKVRDQLLVSVLPRCP